MHVIHFGFSCGAIIGPLATDPFLASKQCLNVSTTTNNTSVTVTTTATIYSTTLIFEEDHHWRNMTNATEIGCVDVYGKTRVQYAFIQTAILAFLAALPFCITWITGKDVNTEETMKLKKDHESTEHNSRTEEVYKLPELNLKTKIVFAVLLALLLAIYCGIESRFSEFLMTFVIEKLDWPKPRDL